MMIRFEHGDQCFNYHEITLCFPMQLPQGCGYLADQGPFASLETEGAKSIFQWFQTRPEVLSSLPLLPSFLRRALEKLPESVQHVVHHDG